MVLERRARASPSCKGKRQRFWRAVRWSVSTAASTAAAVQIRKAGDEDREEVWAILAPVIRAGETYALPRNLEREAALAYWFAPGVDVFVAEREGRLAGTYRIGPNHAGGGAHVANCGYVTASGESGRGIGRAMCAHSLEYARQRGYRAMQFNFVVSTNARAVRLWESFGFATVGRLPEAFLHPVHGYVDALIMFRRL